MLSLLISDVNVGTLFPQKPTIPFNPEIKGCPHCRGNLNVQKTQEKTVVTMDIGAFFAKEIILECPQDQMTFVSPELRKLVPAQGTFGFEVIE